jgi:hypothetical protein
VLLPLQCADESSEADSAAVTIGSQNEMAADWVDGFNP